MGNIPVSTIEKRSHDIAFFRIVFSITLFFLSFPLTAQTTYSNILFMGNSITRHGFLPSIGWPNNWGMAASDSSKDYVHRLISKIDSVQGFKPDFHIVGMAKYEANFRKYDPPTKFLKVTNHFNPDLIIVQIGDNVKKDTALTYNFGQIYFRFLEALKAKHATADIICVTKFWANPTIDTMIVNSAQRAKVKIVDISALSLDPKNKVSSERYFKNSDIRIHPGDVGMENIALVIFGVLYEGKREEN